MKQLTGLTRFLLFFTSYLPLVIIFLIIDFKDLKFPFFNHPIACAITIVAIALLLIFTRRFVFYFQDSQDRENVEIVSVESMDSEVLSYIFSNILPFLGFPAERRMAVVIFLLIVVGIIYSHSNMIGINPVLSILFGFHILKVEFKKADWPTPKTSILLSRLSFWELKHEKKICITQLHNEIFMLIGRIK
jgi:hypothetical protein